MIPEKATESELLSLFKGFGEVKEFAIIKLGDSQNKGYGFCHFTKRCDAIKAIKSLNGKTYLHVWFLNYFLPLGIYCLSGCEIC